MLKIIEPAIQDFESTFGEKATAWGCAPGRVEVLGNHTDYNEGFILSAAIDRHIVVCGRAIEGDTAKVYSRTFNTGESFSVSDPKQTTQNFWINYVEGVVDQLQKQGIKLGGFEAVLMGDIPLGSGLSSSAALEVATCLFLQQLFPFEMDMVKVALTCQAAENNFVGVNCGILDQFSSCMGKKDELIFLDCRDLAKYDNIPLGAGVELVLANTNAKHELADGTYNRLRENCFDAAKHYNEKLDKDVTHLRDVTVDEFEEHLHSLDADTGKRAKHVVTENERVLKGVEALRKGDRKTMGEMMLGSHRSSQHDFGNSCKELDVMVDCAEG
ncbi:MAG: galactokinase, partial [Planctomycetes bacterium]|nr:galactokinase [Planctomycetota bacterium]